LLAVGVLVALTVVLVGVSVAIAAQRATWHEPSGYLPTATFVAVGALLAVRRPRNPIGWLFLVTALSGAWLAASSQYGSFAVDALRDGGSLPPGAKVVGVLGPWGFVASVGALVIAVFYLPDGRLRSSRWRLAVATTVFGAVLLGFIEMTAPWPPEFVGVQNPLDLPAVARLRERADLVAAAALIGGMLAAVVQVALRFRGSTGVARQQLKCVVAGAVAAFLVSLLSPLVPFVPFVTHAVVAAVAMSIIPVSVGAAVLRYRLYDLDRIVSRTATYLVVTGLLVATYAVAALGIGAVLRTVTGGTSQSDLAVAGSTLIVAALFRPLRSRIQRVVDHRFNRTRYDAKATVDALASRLRDAIAIDTLVDDLEQATAAAVQPRSVSLWLSSR
jgi:hypothetical protein